jgi:hypothetical protein
MMVETYAPTGSLLAGPRVPGMWHWSHRPPGVDIAREQG